MAIRALKPITPSTRGTKLEDRSMLEKAQGPRGLTINKVQKSGRNNQGKVTVRHRGGGVKRRIRVVDYKREKFDIPAKVMAFYFDPNRSANLALLQYADGEKRYIIAPRNLNIGDSIVSSESVDILPGNATRLKSIPSGTLVHCVEIQPGRGAALARSAGNSIVVQGFDSTGKYIQVKMPSGELRLISANCLATIGQVGNEDRLNVKYGKAGRKRNLGWRPSVRGMAMHAVQHPHGGGEGKGVVGGGYHGAKDIWGNRVGTRTRKNKRTERFIIKTRRTKNRPFAKK